MFNFNLSRVTSSGKFRPEIDGLRFFAILPVLLAHAAAVFNHNVSSLDDLMTTSFGWVFSGGALGVQLFFVISGYILGSGFYRFANENNKPDFKQYYLRRLTRLEPPYLLIMSFLFIISILLGRFGFFEGFGNYLASIFYLHNIIFEKGSIINTVAWTLEIELQFYLFAPLLFYVYRMKKQIAICIFVVMLFSFLITSFVAGSYHYSIFSHGHFFVLGAFLHILKRTRVYLCFSLDFMNLLLFIMLLMFFYTLDFGYSSFYGNLIKLFCLLLIFSVALESLLVKKILSSPFLYLFGGMCYTIYLIHYPMLSFLSKLWAKLELGGHFFVFLPLALFLVAMLSVALFVLVERPFMDPRLIKNRWEKYFSKRYEKCS